MLHPRDEKKLGLKYFLSKQHSSMPKKLKLFSIVDTISTIQPLFPLRSSRDNSLHPDWLREKKRKRNVAVFPRHCSSTSGRESSSVFRGRIEERTGFHAIQNSFRREWRARQRGIGAFDEIQFKPLIWHPRNVISRSYWIERAALPRHAFPLRLTSILAHPRIPDNIVPLSALPLLRRSFFRPRSFMRISLPRFQKNRDILVIYLKKNFS